MNRKTNLGILVLLTAITAFGIAAAVAIAATRGDTTSIGEAFRLGIATGIAACGAFGAATYAFLVIQKARQPVAA